MFALNHIIVSDFHHGNPHLLKLYNIFSETLNKNLTYRQFRIYYFKNKPEYIDITFIKDGSKTIGFICVTFYKLTLANKTKTICRTALGILEQYRGGNFPCWQLCKKYMAYKIKYPFEEIYVTAYVANPIVYAMICKHAHSVYPKTGVKIPPCISKLSEDIIQRYGLTKNVISPFVLKIHFQVKLSSKCEERIYSSKDKHVLFYLEQNPDFQKQVGVLTIVPVTWKNIGVSALRALIRKPLKKFIAKRNSLNDIVTLVYLYVNQLKGQLLKLVNS